MRFETCAQSYDEYARAQQIFARRVAKFAQISSRTAVVELGAGTGVLTEALCHLPEVSITATDVSPAMLDIGKRRAPAASWRLLDAFRETVPKADLQISSGLLQWAEDPAEVLGRWRAGVRAGGRMIHAFPCEPCLQEWRRLVPEAPLHWRTQEQWLAAFHRAGLRVARREFWIELCEFDSAIAMLRSLHRSGVTGAPQVSSGRLRRAIREYGRLHPFGNGVVATWAWMAIEAVDRG